jgi:hypothetical protein
MADGTYKLTQDAIDFYNLVKGEQEKLTDEKIGEKISDI